MQDKKKTKSPEKQKRSSDESLRESERRQAQTELRESEKRYRILADNVSDLVFVADFNMQFTYCSPSVKELLGYTPEEFLSKGIEEIVTPSSYELAVKTVMEEMEMEREGQKDFSGPKTMDVEVIRKDKSTI